MSEVSYIIQGEQITLVIDNKPYQIGNTHLSYNKILKAIKNGKMDKLIDLVDPKEVLLAYSEGLVEINGSTLMWAGAEMHNSISAKMIEMCKEGFPITPLVNFLSNIMDNPSNRAINELYGFLESGNLPITEDGNFLAYKRVNEDYTDCYTGKISNAIGEMVSMPRNAVNDDSNQTCSHGLHFCSLDYLRSFSGARVVILKINPRDVVSIPADYNDTKGRCCKYSVVGEVDDLYRPETTFSSTVVDNNFSDVPTATIMKNSSNQWVRVASGTFASKAEIAAHKDLTEKLRNK